MGNNSNSKSIEDFKLSNNELNLLRLSWNEIQTVGLSELGIGLMTRLLIEHKEIKPIWRKRMGVGDENVDYSNPNQVIKTHGEKVFNTLGNTLNSLDNLNKLAPELIKMGYDHYKYGTRPEHFVVN